MVDTDVMIDLFRGLPQAMVWFSSNHDEILLSRFVVMELLSGCRTKRELNAVQKTLRNVHTIWLRATHAEIAQEIFETHHLKNNIGIIDVFIGQTAVQEALPLYTFNHKHYKIIPNLQLVQPYKR
ncbi:MAG: type II toxin-antitoxin system VapC family toxin [Candidatus Kapabacteria bacterium]|jgi:hypothetical protein|nr:type II toxin-antitoxin system VapC family toxin [Candidatus Kapabacteria bacterium]